MAEEPPPPDTRPTDDLMDAGYAALDGGEYETALALAAELRRRRHSSNFEIEARARWAMGEREAALRILEEGVATAPKAAPLWHWLACYRSDLGRYDAALDAYAKEAEFEHVSASSNAYNVAVVYERMGRPRDALDLLDGVELPGPDGPSPAHFAELRARLQFDVGEFAAAADAATRALDLFSADIQAAAESDEALAEVAGGGSTDGDTSAPHLDWTLPPRAYAVRADAKLQAGDRQGALEDATEAIDLHPARAPGRAMDVLRRAEGLRSPRARRLRILFQGELGPEEKFRGLFVSMDVIADDPAEGVEFARRFVPDAARPTLAVEEVVDDGVVAPGELKGVYSCGDLYAFDPDVPDEDETEISDRPA